MINLLKDFKMIDELLKLSNEEILEKVLRKYNDFPSSVVWNVFRSLEHRKIVLCNLDGDYINIDSMGMISNKHEPIFIFNNSFTWS